MLEMLNIPMLFRKMRHEKICREEIWPSSTMCIGEMLVAAVKGFSTNLRMRKEKTEPNRSLHRNVRRTWNTHTNCLAVVMRSAQKHNNYYVSTNDNMQSTDTGILVTHFTPFCVCFTKGLKVLTVYSLFILGLVLHYSQTHIMKMKT